MKIENTWILAVKNREKKSYGKPSYFPHSKKIFFLTINPKRDHPKGSHYHFWVFHIFFHSYSHSGLRKWRSEFFLPLKVSKMTISGSVTWFLVPKFPAPPNESLRGSPPPVPRGETSPLRVLLYWQTLVFSLVLRPFIKLWHAWVTMADFLITGEWLII